MKSALVHRRREGKKKRRSWRRREWLALVRFGKVAISSDYGANTARKVKREQDTLLFIVYCTRNLVYYWRLALSFPWLFKQVHSEPIGGQDRHMESSDTMRTRLNWSGSWHIKVTIEDTQRLASPFHTIVHHCHFLPIVDQLRQLPHI